MAPIFWYVGSLKVLGSWPLEALKGRLGPGNTRLYLALFGGRGCHGERLRLLVLEDVWGNECRPDYAAGGKGGLKETWYVGFCVRIQVSGFWEGGGLTQRRPITSWQLEYG